MSAPAEVQRLLATYEVQDKSGAGVASAVGGLGRLEGRGASVMSRLSGLGQNFGNAMGHAAGRLKSLATAGLGLLGIGGGLAIGGFLKGALGKVQEFGAEVVRLMDLTKLTAGVAGTWAGIFEHFGIGADQATSGVQRLITNVGKLTGNLKSEQKWTEQFGFMLRTGTLSAKDMAAALAVLDDKHATHKARLAASTTLQKYFNSSVKDANALILTAVDYYNNKSIPITEKAAVLAKVLGKNWAEWLPILKAGRAGLGTLGVELERMGLKVTPENIKALGALKTAQRDWHSSLSALEIAVGIKLVPTLTKFTNWASTFLSSHSQQILQFFDNAAGFVETLVDAASRIPSGLGITDMIKGAIAAWDRLPDGLRDLLVKGIVADRTVKFLFGFSPIGTVGSAIGSAISSALGSGIGKVIGNSVGESLLGGVQKVFVVNPGFGAGGGGLPGLPAAGAAAPALGLGALAVGLAAVTAFGVAVGLVTKAIDDRLGVTPINLREQQFNRTQQNLTPDNPRVSDAIRDEGERLRQAINTGFHKDVAGELDKARSTIIATGEKDRAKATAIVTSLENQRHSMLSKQSTANGLLTRIANKKTNVHITIPVNNNIRAVISGNNAYHTTTINGVVTPLDL